MSWSSRVWLLIASCAFAVTAVVGAVLVYLEPTGESVGRIALALLFSLVCLHLATRRQPSSRAASAALAGGAGAGAHVSATGGPAAHGGVCASCGARLDASLSFCARCGT